MTTLTHDPLCRLLKKDKCHGIGGTDVGHYLDQKVCRNCHAECDCDRIAELRSTIASEAEQKLAAVHVLCARRTYAWARSTLPAYTREPALTVAEVLDTINKAGDTT
jgi:hypothetical protein